MNALRRVAATGLPSPKSGSSQTHEKPPGPDEATSSTVTVNQDVGKPFCVKEEGVATGQVDLFTSSAVRDEEASEG